MRSSAGQRAPSPAVVSMALLVGCVLMSALSAAAQPIVTVRATTRFELAGLGSAGDEEAILEGVLRDDLGQGLPQREVTLSVSRGDQRARTIAIITDNAGAFRVPLGDAGGRYRVIARFGGSPFHDPCELVRELDLTRADVQIVIAPLRDGQLNLDRPEAVVEVLANERHGAAQAPAPSLRISLKLAMPERAAIDGTEGAPVRLGTQRTDERGLARFVLNTESLGDPGTATLIATAAADDRRSGAETRVRVLRTRGTALMTSLSRTEIDPGETIVATGELFDAVAGVPGRAIGIFDGEQHLATTTTGPRGTYRVEFRVQPPSDAPRERSIVARFDGDGGRLGSSSPALTVTVTAPSNRWPWLALPTALIAMLLLWSRRRDAREDEAPDLESAAEAGIFAARTSRAPATCRVAGRVLHHVGGAPVVGATVRLGDAVVETDTNGRFGFEGEPGRVHLEVTAPGFLPQTAELTLPHRGEWSALVVRAERYRDRAMAIFRGVAARLVPSNRAWAVTTNREVSATARGGAAGAMRTLAEQTDEIYYGAGVKGPDDVDGLAASAARLAPELGEAPADRPPPDPPARTS